MADCRRLNHKCLSFMPALQKAKLRDFEELIRSERFLPPSNSSLSSSKTTRTLSSDWRNHLSKRDNSQSGGLTAPQVGAFVGSVIAFILILAIVFCCCFPNQRRKIIPGSKKPPKRRSPLPSPSPPPPPPPPRPPRGGNAGKLPQHPPKPLVPGGPLVPSRTPGGPPVMTRPPTMTTQKPPGILKKSQTMPETVAIPNPQRMPPPLRVLTPPPMLPKPTSKPELQYVGYANNDRLLIPGGAGVTNIGRTPKGFCEVRRPQRKRVRTRSVHRSPMR